MTKLGAQPYEHIDAMCADFPTDDSNAPQVDQLSAQSAGAPEAQSHSSAPRSEAPDEVQAADVKIIAGLEADRLAVRAQLATPTFALDL